MGQRSPDLLSGLLKDVSRSFYLTLRVLPASIRRQIGLAYLLARSTDTIADTDALPKDERLATLAAVRDRICRGINSPLRLEKVAGEQSSPAERILLQRFEQAITILESLSAADQGRIRRVLEIIVSGQELDLERFAGADLDHIVALDREAELDDYIYRVAGCVGEFWTEMCCAQAFPNAPVDQAFLLANGVRFGKGLQLVNVLRDLPSDLRQGRCYLPRESLKRARLEPENLLQPRNEGRLRPVYLEYLQMAEDHLQAGWAYTNHLPRRHVRIRLACAWPILIGAHTLGRLRTAPILEPGRRTKINRSEVRSILVRTVLWYPFRRKWGGLLQACRAARAARGKPLPGEDSLAK